MGCRHIHTMRCTPGSEPISFNPVKTLLHIDSRLQGPQHPTHTLQDASQPVIPLGTTAVLATAGASPKKRGSGSKAARQGSGALKDPESPLVKLEQQVQWGQEAAGERSLHGRDTGMTLL